VLKVRRRHFDRDRLLQRQADHRRRKLDERLEIVIRQ
jgi:hypothetical protein